MSALASDELCVVVATLHASAEEEDALRSLLSADERARAARFVFERDRRRFVVARGTLRTLLGGYTGQDPRALTFVYGPHGKPALEGDSLPFNLSHSEDLALFAFAREGELGVDLEAIRPELDVDLMTTTFAPEEALALGAVPPGARRDAFYLAWTRKEAYIKALGTGFSLAPERFVVSIEPETRAALLSTTHDTGDPSAWWFRTLRPRPGFLASCAVRRRPEEPDRGLAVRVVDAPAP